MSEGQLDQLPFNPLSPQHLSDPDDRLAAARTQCPVSLPKGDFATLVRDTDVRDVLVQTDVYSAKGNFVIEGELDMPVALITELDAPEHTELRTRLLRWFAPRRLRQLTPEVEAIVEQSLAALPDEGEVELYDAYVRFIPAKVLFAFMGLPKEHWGRIQQWTDVILATVPEPIADLPEMQELMTLLNEVVEQRRSGEPGSGDVIDGLVHAREGESELTAGEVITHLFQLVGAGTDTTRSLIVNTVYRLLESGQWERLVNDRSLLPNAIEESLRLDTPLQFVLRTAKEDTEIGGCPVDAGSKVFLSLQSANHDEETWGVDAREYRPDRVGAASHLAFGRGVHACMGAPLTRIEVIKAIDALLDRYPNMRLSPAATWDRIEAPLLKRPRELRVILG
ncbi:Cytochrome P450 [Amycolatopsis marina]|uniref:Cytochrome P450 n=1 Tax=Amycolatopsis marina TaxID=490629 RepID=A0A1I0WJJ6_9PSEU|nr:cytochrome P450 [Amycolatopsis marina]SFA88734.1 Cytochrome P450 [Amycolatopsis marina]